MKIETKFLGEVEIEKAQIIFFETGIPGFLKSKKFVLLPLEEELPIAMLQSVTEKDVGFLVAYPFAFKEDYAFELHMSDKEQLKIQNERDVLVYSILTLKESLAASTLNLLAPIIINTNERLGKQIILTDSEKYPLRFPMTKLQGSAQ